ncbi:MAG TPA: hypothetical protein ENK86_01635 [Campylobacterales bacterium]|nr:hypothetical protein [Campylobacterales bacterium]
MIDRKAASLEQGIVFNDLDVLLKSLPENIYRVKGMVKVNDVPTPLIVNYSFGNVSFEELRDYDGESLLVFIGENIDERLKQVEFENAWLEKFAYHNQSMQFSDMTKGVEFIEFPKASYLEDEESKSKALPYEWAGLFALQKGTYSWSFAKVGGKYADPQMKFLMLEAAEQGEAIIDIYKERAETLFNSDKATLAQDGDPLQEGFYQLSFDQTKDQTVFRLDIKQDGNYLFFTEHMPFEFEDKEHFLKEISRKDIEPIAADPEGTAHHHHHGGIDPHTWTAPSNVKIMAKNIYETLVELDRENQAYYQANYEKFLEEIEQTDREIKELLVSLPNDSKFMVFHPSWGYFAKEYGLEQLAIEVEGKEPKPRVVQKIIEEARKQEIKAIFTQQEFSDKSARAIARELNIKVIKETPLARDWSANLIKKAKAIANNH